MLRAHAHAGYKWSLRGLSGPEREAALHGAHARAADRLQRLCFANGGVYIKLGQHMAQLVRAHHRFPYCGVRIWSDIDSSDISTTPTSPDTALPGHQVVMLIR